MKPSRLVAASILVGFAAIVAASASLGGCEASRLPVCKTNDDCVSDTPAGQPKRGVCYNLRCVECRYDTDCKDDKICNAAGECKALDASKPAASASEGASSSGG